MEFQMYCETCKVEFSEGLRYCKWCGQQLSRRSRATSELHKCHVCGASVQPGWTYCKSCGIRLVTTGRQPDVICPRCGTAVSVPASECSKCGQDLSATIRESAVAGEAGPATGNVYCPACGGGVEEGATFCKSCGAIIPGSGTLTTPDLGKVSVICPRCNGQNQLGSTH